MRNLLKKPWFGGDTNASFADLLTPHEATVGEIARALNSSARILIGTHEHPDGDALGSSLALAHAMKAQGKEVVVYIPDEPAEFFSFLPGFSLLTTEKPVDQQFDAIVLLDYTQLYRTHLTAEAGGHKQTICIDHHYDNKREAKINLIVPEAAATAHILVALFTKLNIPITKDIATCLLTGIFTDTGSFMHDSVTPEILDMASFLMHRGARLSHIAHETYQRKELPGLKIWGRALSRILTSQTAGPSVALVTLQDLQECGATLDDLSGVVNLLNTLPDTTYAMLLVEYAPGKIKGSLRSEPHKGVDVSKIAKRLGGGGHKLASGFEIEGSIVRHEGQWRIKALPV